MNQGGEQPNVAVGTTGSCSYCGSPLVPGIYFCPICAKPHCEISAVLSKAFPRKLSESELIKKICPHVWPLFWTYVVTIFVIALPVAILLEDNHMVGYLAADIAICLVTAFFTVRYWQSLKVQLTNFGFRHKESYLAFLIMAVLLGVNYIYHGLVFSSPEIEHTDIVAEASAAGFSMVGVFVMLLVVGWNPADV